jgi:hypothetical protein
LASWVRPGQAAGKFLSHGKPFEPRRIDSERVRLSNG